MKKIELPGFKDVKLAEDRHVVKKAQSNLLQRQHKMPSADRDDESDSNSSQFQSDDVSASNHLNISESSKMSP